MEQYLLRNMASVRKKGEAASKTLGSEQFIFFFFLIDLVFNFFFSSLLYLFNFGCAVSSLLCRLFACCSEWGLLCSCKPWSLGVWASVVAEHGLNSCNSQAVDQTGSVAVAHRFSCSRTFGIFPDQGSNLCLLYW